MAEHISLSNTFMAYWENNPYSYPPTYPIQKNNTLSFYTGWHVLPNILWRHFLSPKQWYEMCINYEAYHVEGTSTTVFNPIPITQNLAIQGTNTFTAFNNTIYSMGVTDDLYETAYYNWYEDKIWKNWYVAYKEGHIPKTTTQDGITTSWDRLTLPVYSWESGGTAPETNVTWTWNTSVDTGGQNFPTSGTTWPHTDVNEQRSFGSGCFWDPFCNPDSIQELRPGKNAMSFHWKTHGADEHCWYNLDTLAKLFPYQPESGYLGNTDSTGKYHGPAGSRVINPLYQQPEPQTSLSSLNKSTWLPYTIPNVLNCPIVPISWFWIELERNLIEDKKTEKPQIGWPGTEWATPKYPPMQNFVKGVPLTDEHGTLVTTTTMACFRNTLHLSLKKRRSRMFAPTWGPMSWEMTHALDGQFVLPTVRYRTGGGRRNWQAKTR